MSNTTGLRYHYIAYSIVFISFIIALILLPAMPEEMASHWNSAGEVDDYMPKFWGLFLMPLVSAGILILFKTIPKIDPLKKNIEKFRNYFDLFIVFILLFLFYIYMLTLAWNYGIKFNMTRFILPGFAILLYYIAILTENAKQNWFIGIRTPWTLSNEKVWDKTHKLGGKLFKFCAILAFIALLFEKIAFILVIGPVIGTALFLFIYSYIEYRKITKK